MTAKRQPERRRAPFDYADTDWGREQERRHRENIARFEAGDKRFDAIDTKLVGIDGKLGGIDAKLDELTPVAAGVRGAKKVGKFAWGAGLLAGKAAKFWWGLVGAAAFGYAILHGDGWRAAVEAFAKAFK